MRNIEKRAEEFADKYAVGDAAIIVDLIHKVAKECYIKGATEQKTIDDEEYRKDMRYVGVKREELIEKACNWTCSQCPLRCRETLISGSVVCAKYIDKTDCKSLQSLIKAMEE